MFLSAAAVRWIALDYRLFLFPSLLVPLPAVCASDPLDLSVVGACGGGYGRYKKITGAEKVHVVMIDRSVSRVAWYSSFFLSLAHSMLLIARGMVLLI
jgi:hypothetical protein